MYQKFDPNSLSMIGAWVESIGKACQNLKFDLHELDWFNFPSELFLLKETNTDEK
jgi:hypothetical protein